MSPLIMMEVGSILIMRHAQVGGFCSDISGGFECYGRGVRIGRVVLEVVESFAGQLLRVVICC